MQHYHRELLWAALVVILSEAKNLTWNPDTERDVRFFASLRMTALGRLDNDSLAASPAVGL
jgi:hypothetical protein